MAHIRVFLILAALLLVCAAAPAQQPVRSDSLGLPGDNLNLYAVLRVFQESATLEEFEKKLNSEEGRINNLDLNGDDKIDFIRVIDNMVDGNHDIVLQVPVSETEAQDVAVIHVEKDAQNRVTIQIIGDEELYGKNYIVEPNYEPAGENAAGVTPNPGYTGGEKETVLSPDGETVSVERTTPAAVAGWPVVQCIYMPAYEPWPSPWYYGYYPPWWRPWRPFFWHYYWGYHLHQYGYYFGHYRRWNAYRNERARLMYTGSLRRTSVIVVDRGRSGAYRTTYARPELRRVGIRQSSVLRGRNLNPRSPRISTSPRERMKPGIEATPRGRQQGPGNARPPVFNPGRRTPPADGAPRGRREPQEGKVRGRGERPGK